MPGIETSSDRVSHYVRQIFMWVCLFEDGAAPHGGPAVGHGSTMKRSTRESAGVEDERSRLTRRKRESNPKPALYLIMAVCCAGHYS